jgi:hypothetical protein
MGPSVLIYHGKSDQQNSDALWKAQVQEIKGHGICLVVFLPSPLMIDQAVYRIGHLRKCNLQSNGFIHQRISSSGYTKNRCQKVL